MRQFMRVYAPICLVACIVAQTAAQETAPSPPAFEVVSIKPRVGDTVLRAGPSSPDRFDDPDTTLWFLIRWAYELFDFEVVGGPDWLDMKRWQVSAKSPAAVSLAEKRQLVRRMLADRFALKTHTETRELPIYHLVLARSDRQLGPKIKSSTIDCTPFLTGKRPMAESPRDPDNGMPACSSGGAIAGGVLTPRLNGQPLTGLITTLQATLQKRVVDKTGLQGNFDIALSYFDERLNDRLASGGASLLAGTEGASLITALQEQLGMKLESARGPVQVLVIDSVSEPTTN
jgi:uncharacterized protein (TIGR03435 family)